MVFLYSVLKYTLNFQRFFFEKNQELVLFFFIFVQSHFIVSCIIILLKSTCILYDWLCLVRPVQKLMILFKKKCFVYLLLNEDNKYSLLTGIGHLNCKLMFVNFCIIIIFSIISGNTNLFFHSQNNMFIYLFCVLIVEPRQLLSVLTGFGCLNCKMLFVNFCIIIIFSIILWTTKLILSYLLTDLIYV